MSPFLTIAALGLLGFGTTGCTGPSDPVAATSSSESITIAPEATKGPEAAAEAQAERERKQAEADRAAGRR